MKNLFFKRHKVFFIAFVLLLFSEVILLNRYLKVYKKNSILSATIQESSRILDEKSKNLPASHLAIEQKTNSIIKKYRQFISDTWSNITQREYEFNKLNAPSNNIALFFEISNFVTQNRELCNSLGINYEEEYSFSFKEYLNKKEQPLGSEIDDIHLQKEQISLFLNHLFEARTTYLKIDSIKRGIKDSAITYRNGDTFLIDNNSIVSSILSTNTYRITFETFTETFRKYLNNLRNSEIPFIIREIKIEPYKQTYINKQSQEYIVQGIPTKYTLTLEMLNIAHDITKQYKRDAQYYRRKTHVTHY